MPSIMIAQLNLEQGRLFFLSSAQNGYLQALLENRNMTYQTFNKFCQAFKASTYVMQWGGSHVWKVGGKVYAIGGWDQERPAYTFKVTALEFEILRNQPGLRPAPYLASRGMTWIQHYDKPGLNDKELKEYIRESYELVVDKLTKKVRQELGLN